MYLAHIQNDGLAKHQGEQIICVSCAYIMIITLNYVEIGYEQIMSSLNIVKKHTSTACVIYTPWIINNILLDLYVKTLENGVR